MDSFQKGHDMVPYRWMLEPLSLVGAAESVTEEHETIEGESIL